LSEAVVKQYLPREIFSISLRPKAKIVEFLVYIRISRYRTIVAKALKLMDRLGFKLVYGSFYFEGRRVKWLFFVDISKAKSSVEAFYKELSSIQGVLEVKYQEIYKLFGDISIEMFHYPTTILGERSIVFRFSDVVRAFRALWETFGEGAAPILFLMGINTGKELASLISRFTKLSHEQGISLFKEISRAVGWGIVEIAGFDKSRYELVVRVYDCWESAVSRGLAKSPGCYFTKGIIKGLADTYSGFESEVEEVKCRARGDDYCEFICKVKARK